MAVNLSSYGYNMLRIFAQRDISFRMPLEIARKYDQRPFGTMLAREYVKWDRGAHGFYLTDEGREAYKAFETQNILRRIESLRMTHWFHLPKRSMGQAVPIRKAAAA